MNVEIYTKLVTECNRQIKALQEDDSTINMCEHKYLTNCLDCMEYMETNYSIDLDCSEVSLEVIDMFFENAHTAYVENSLDHIDLFVEMFAGYVGMVFKNELGGNFVYDEHGESLDIDSNPIYINELVKECIVHGNKISDDFHKIKELTNETVCV